MTRAFRPARPGHLALGALIGALLEGPQTVPDLMEASGLYPNTIRQYVLTWRKQKVLRIAEWHSDGRNRLTLAAYALGKGKDAARPPKQTGQARAAANRLRAKAHAPLMLLAGVDIRITEPETQ